MPFPFRMTFTGLCALVPNTNGKEGRVLLVDASTATGARHAHVPWLRYLGFKHSLAKTEVEINLTNPVPAILTLFSPTLTTPPPPPAAHRPISQTNEEKSFFWIGDLASASAPLKAGCLDATRPSIVTSRIKLNAGDLTSSGLIEDTKQQGKVVPLAWALFDPAGNPAPGFHRALAAQFSVTAMIDDGSLTIKNASTSITLTLKSEGGEAVVDVGNTCDCVDTQGPLDDFGWFYELSTATNLFLPVRTGFGVTDTMCPPARFAADPRA